MAGTLTVDTIQSDSSYASTLNVASKVNFTSGMQIGGQDTTFGGMRNRIINGDMRIDQRNAGASVTASTAAYTFITDRFKVYSAGATKLSGQRTTTAPTGFNNSLAITSLAATSPSASDEYQLYAPIEGYNIADLGWGTASAKPITISFWVRSSLTGTFSGCLYNPTGSPTVTYIFTYTISNTNTWEYKTITIPGNTTATWGSENSGGITIVWDFGSGSALNGTAGSWATGFDSRTSDSVTLVGTNGATWYITGVQLEKGSAVTAFENRHYGQELALCQRYYYQATKSDGIGNRPITIEVSTTGSTYYPVAILQSPVTMRATPTATVLGTVSLQNASFDSFTSVNNGAKYQIVVSTTGGRAFALSDVTGSGYSLNSEL